jgi:hypothetical protein
LETTPSKTGLAGVIQDEFAVAGLMDVELYADLAREGLRSASCGGSSPRGR